MKNSKIGALWKKKSKDGTKTFLTGKIGDQDVIVFANTRKSEDKQPDFEVFKSENRKQAAPPPPPSDEFDF